MGGAFVRNDLIHLSALFHIHCSSTLYQNRPPQMNVRTAFSMFGVIIIIRMNL